jgi:hypothetical protein
MEEIISKNKDMEETFYNSIDEIEQTLLLKYVELVRKFNKAYFANKAENLRQLRKQEGNDIASLIAKINENYIKNGNHLSSELKEEDYSQSYYDEEKCQSDSRGHTPQNYRNRRDTHQKTTNPSAMNQRYRETKHQTSSSRVPFQIFDQHLRTPNYNEGYENMDVDQITPQKQERVKISEFSIYHSDNESRQEHKSAEKEVRFKPLLPSERLKTVPEAKAELVDINSFIITVKITPPATEGNVQNNIININTTNNHRKRHRTSKFAPPGQPNNYKSSNYMKDEEHGYVSENEYNENQRYYRHEMHNKRARKNVYKRSRDVLMDTPPTLYRLGNIDKRADKGEQYGYKQGAGGYEYPGTYYVVPSNRMPPNQYMYYNPNYMQENASPMNAKYDKKYGKERIAPFYPSFYGMPPCGTCPG